MDYKDTLLLPKTNFPMRGNLGKREEEFKKRWEEIKLYEKSLKLNQNNPSFVLHDGPPYANGPIHIGHALNKLIKDFIVRYKTLQGFYSPYIPGWDTHGLPIESALQKKGISHKNMSIIEFRKQCEIYALEQVEIQKEQFKRLGILGEWDNPYITLKPQYEADQLRVFATMVDKGLIYKGLRPVYWSPSSESALAEAEIIYQDVKSPSVYAAFEVVSGKFAGEKLIIWTTTPWTLPANLAISVHPNLEYVSVKTAEATYIVAKSLYKQVMERLNIKDYRVVAVYSGEELENTLYNHPLNDKTLPVILGEHVSADDGTGLVHTAPGHGEDDFIVGKRYNLDVLVPIDEKGYFTAEAGKYEGLFYQKANTVIVEDLKALDALLDLSFIEHSYPHDWRTRKPIIFRATPQWFASIEPIRTQLLAEIEKTEWVQSWGKLRIHNMIVDRGDWCISRQRFWGVPIPVFYAENDEAIIDGDLIRHVADIFAEKGSNSWFELDSKELLPKGYTHPGSPNGIFRKETDIMDVWFDSGTSHSILKHYNINYPADIYSEGSDQYRGWFNSSLTTGVAATGKAPYKIVNSHGFVLDEKNRAMSKSMGNAIDPQQLVRQSGADILRLWVSSVDYSSDVKIGPETIRLATETYRKIRNTFRYMLANLFDFDPQTNLIDYTDLNKMDQVMLIKLEQLKEEAFKHYDHYRFDLVNRLITNYVINDLSAYYLDYSKDILYVEGKNSFKRRSAQSVIYYHLLELLLLLNPIIPFTTSEAYWELPFLREEDIFLERFSKPKENLDNNLLNYFKDFTTLRNAVLIELEKLRKESVIGKSLEADLVIKAPQKIKDAIDKLEVNLRQVLMVAHAKVEVDETLSVSATLAKGFKCERCWNIVDEVDENNLCKRCQEVLKGM
ncbi:MAG: isoleucine--tRNA ligase [Acholeplasmataceae bacterium]|jgi:isoleucyl-tRNA synthetase|nr:isoleucine--tRNA ligase [Acholeplasmataceae bacterium]